MGLLQAGYLLPLAGHVGAVEIGAGGGEIAAVVDGVNRTERIGRPRQLIHANRAEIVADGLQRAIEGFGNPAEIRRAGRGRRPCRNQRRYADECQPGRRTRAWSRTHQGARQVAVAGVIVGHQIDPGLVQMLAQSFVIGEHERLVAP